MTYSYHLKKLENRIHNLGRKATSCLQYLNLMKRLSVIKAIAAVELRWNLQELLIVLQPYKVILFKRITENTG